MIFSDHDINEIWKLIQGSGGLTDSQRLEFIKGFEEGWNLLKKTGHLFENKLLFKHTLISRPTLANYLLGGINENPKNFGKALGAFIGMIRFDSERFIFDSRTAELCVNYLKSQQEFIVYISKKISEWKLNVRKPLEKWYNLQSSSLTAHPEIEKLIKKYETLKSKL